jgi:hypothetical protein
LESSVIRPVVCWGSPMSGLVRGQATRRLGHRGTERHDEYLSAALAEWNP